jgi:hypothetical protein
MLMRSLLTIPLMVGVIYTATAVAAPEAAWASSQGSAASSSAASTAGTASSTTPSPPGKGDTTIPASRLPKVVYLTSARALDELRASNPAHYARAKRILADADQICRPGKPQIVPLQLDAQDIGCARSMIFTSYPPQRQLRFRLDDTVYVAMVFLSETDAKLTPAAGALNRVPQAALAIATPASPAPAR